MYQQRKSQACLLFSVAKPNLGARHAGTNKVAM